MDDPWLKVKQDSTGNVVLIVSLFLGGEDVINKL